ncbi:MAG: hypothetical protein JWP59_4732 [Massilia sp.]|nr:hypothetical protein [Massilia sp.]
MAAYVCPELTKPAMPKMMEGMPCAEMDEENPVQCAKAQAGDELALEQLAAPPALTRSKISFVMPVMTLAVPLLLTVFWPDSPPELGSDPPYFRTQRLRI